MDKAIKKSLERVKKVASKEEKSLVKKDMKRDAECDKAMKMSHGKSPKRNKR